METKLVRQAVHNQVVTLKKSPLFESSDECDVLFGNFSKIYRKLGYNLVNY